MCGIAVIIGDKPHLENKIKASLKKIVHRGNLNFEYKIFDGAAIGANRLAIVDDSLGVQPQSNENKTIFAVQNGEIFNFKKLKNKLLKRGHVFKTDCDTEVLVHLYEEYGPQFVKMLDSEMFAFCIYNNKTGDYLIARDPVGVKPLYYGYDNDGCLHVGSELKQLVQFSEISEVYEFPPGNYLHNGKFFEYIKFEVNDTKINTLLVKRKLKVLVEDAIQKRVQTKLPIGVFLSGGVDSSLVMKLATKYHEDVTAFILGNPGSTDLEYALRFCQENNYKYKIVYPDIDYEKEIKELIYYLETYEPLIVRQAFANNIISKAAAEMGIKVILTGEAVDELFAGYNEFSHLNSKNINKGCKFLLDSLSRGHHMRVDKMAMRYTVEIRSPFFDTDLIKYALKINGELKIKKNNHRITTKYIWREMAREYLPNYIADRFKAPFANGAGMDIGFNYRSQDGQLAKLAKKNISTKQYEELKNNFPEYNFTTFEECYYFTFYKEFGFEKYKEGRKRLLVKDNLVDLEDNGELQRLLVAEFDKLPMYFPAYLGLTLGHFEKNGLDVDFVATGGDDKTFSSLIENSAQIGMADPMFAMVENPYTIKGKILGSLFNTAPLYIVTLKKEVVIDNIEDIKQYTVATYEKYSTTNTITRVLIKDHSIKEIHHSQIVQEMKDGCADVAIVSSELAHSLVASGGRIVFSIKDIVPHLLFAGFTVSENIESKYTKVIPNFLQAMKDSLEFIQQNPKKALKLFKKEFNISNHNEVFEEYLKIWSKDLSFSQEDWDKAVYYWRTAHPKIFSEINPYYTLKGKEEIIFNILQQRKYSRSKPFKEFKLRGRIKDRMDSKKPITLVGFWGASDKKGVDASDISAIQRLEELQQEVGSVYPSGLMFNFILADGHAEQNGYKKENYNQYLKEIKSELEKKGWKVIFLSDLWKKYAISSSSIKQQMKKWPMNWWRKVNIRNRLIKQASKHTQHKDKIEGAKFYYAMRREDSKILLKEYPSSIFWAYSGEDMQELYPDLPTLYLHSIKKNHGTAPWFISS